MAKYPTPLPLFDTLANIKELKLPGNVDFSFADEDFSAAKGYLIQYDGSEATYNAYRREVERLIQWSWLIANKSILKLSRENIEAYMKFCLNPPKSWINLKHERRFVVNQGQRIQNKRWRPFVMTVSKAETKKGVEPSKSDYQLSQQGISDIFKVLSSFYNYLMLESIAMVNPVALIRQKSKYIQKRQDVARVRRLTERQWQFCIETAEAMADKTPEKHERTLFIITALYLMYLRISELAASERWTPKMKHFFCDNQKSWWFTTVGKGNKLRDISVSNKMIEALKRWRSHLELSTLPATGDDTPLLPKRLGKGPITETRYIRSIVQECFDETAKRLRSKGFRNEAQGMMSVTVHWLRHTGISDDVKHRPKEHVRDDAGHSTSAITDRYVDVERKKRNLSAKDKPLVAKGE